jgi:biotin carboxylase
VAEILGLPRSLTVEQALAVTNKRYMKAAFDRLGIPHNPYRIVSSRADSAELRELRPPLVLKPVDSQGQRGVVRLEHPEELSGYLPESLSFSRDGYAVVEEFYPGDEICFTGWVRNGKTYPLSITDRRTKPNYPHIGVCVAHTYPSRHFARHGEEILGIAGRIVEGLGIRRGPLYFQMLIGSEGVRVNEIACRIGGAYEDEFIPALTGVDLNLLNFREALEMEVDEKPLKDFPYPAKGALAVLLFFTASLTVERTASMDEVKALPGVLNARYLLSQGKKVGPLRNSTGRAGYVILKGDSGDEVNRGVREVYRRLGVFDRAGENMVLDHSAESMVEYG